MGALLRGYDSQCLAVYGVRTPKKAECVLSVEELIVRYRLFKTAAGKCRACAASQCAANSDRAAVLCSEEPFISQDISVFAPKSFNRLEGGQPRDCRHMHLFHLTIWLTVGVIHMYNMHHSTA